MGRLLKVENNKKDNHHTFISYVEYLLGCWNTKKFGLSCETIMEKVTIEIEMTKSQFDKDCGKNDMVNLATRYNNMVEAINPALNEIFEDESYMNIEKCNIVKSDMYRGFITKKCHFTIEFDITKKVNM